MSDLIERDKVIEYCLKLIDVERKQGTDVMNYGQERINQTDAIIAFVENLPSARPKGMTKEIHDINTRALDFVVELIEYIFEYPDDDYMTMECLCRKLHKHGLVDKKDGFYLVADDTLRKTEPQTEREGE